MAELLKTEGNAFLKAGKLIEAAEKYTGAIEADSTNEKYFGNRSAAYQKLAVQQSDASFFEKAIEDADRAIALAPAWFKGYSHKANSLWSMNRKQDALNAAKAGAAACPGNEKLSQLVRTFQEGMERAMENTVSYLLWGNQKNAQRSSMAPLRFLIMLCVVGYANPLGSPATTYAAWRRAMMLQMLDVIMHVASTYGWPKMSKLYAESLIKDPMTHRMFLCALCFTANKPNVIVMFAALGLTVGRALSFLTDILEALPYVGSLAKIVRSVHAAAVAPLYGYPNWATLTELQRRWVFEQKCAVAACFAEVVYGLWLIAELLTPMRNLVGVLFTWQFLRIRYMIDPHSKHAFGSIHALILSGLPGILVAPYSKVVGFMSSYAEMPTMPAPGEERKGVMQSMKEKVSKCTIM